MRHSFAYLASLKHSLGIRIGNSAARNAEHETTNGIPTSTFSTWSVIVCSTVGNFSQVNRESRECD
jgi:hypothetical protein